MDSSLIRFGILTVSDRCSHGEAEDKSGPALESCVRSSLEFSGIVIRKECVPDNVLDISRVLMSWSEEGESSCDVVMTTGGTGFSNRDVTPEATLSVVTRRCDALAMVGSIKSNSKFSFLSRAAAGIRNQTLIINLPGSVRGATECFEALAPLLTHAVHLVTGRLEAAARTHSLAASAPMSHSLQHSHLLHSLYPGALSRISLTNSKINNSPPLLTSSVKKVGSGLRVRKSPWPMINLTEAQNVVLLVAEKVSPTLERIPLMQAVGRVGGECYSSINLPPFRASVKDGYAVRAADGTSHRRIIASSSAGQQSQSVIVGEGECVRINTGAPLPSGTDAVVQVEDTKVLKMTEDSEEVEIEVLQLPTLGQDIREIGSDMASGSVLVEDGDRITSSCLGVLASAGLDHVPCWSVRVCVFSTGDELVDVGKQLPEGKIYDSNRSTLLSLLKENSFPATNGGILPDQCDEIYRRLFEELKWHDVIITTGSVSMGDKDYLKQVLASDLKANIHFGRIDLKPGKPTTFAELKGEDGRQKLIFSLPGNPVSAAVTCHLLVLPALKKITKHKKIYPPIIKVKVSQDVKFDDCRQEFKRAIVTYCSSGLPTASITGGQASSRLGSMLEANALVTCDKNCTSVPKGSTVDAFMIGNLKFDS